MVEKFYLDGQLFQLTQLMSFSMYEVNGHINLSLKTKSNGIIRVKFKSYVLVYFCGQIISLYHNRSNHTFVVVTKYSLAFYLMW